MLFLHRLGFGPQIIQTSTFASREGRPRRGTGVAGVRRNLGTTPTRIRTYSRYGDWAAEFLRTIGVDQPTLVMGHSFGGGIAMKLTPTTPEQVRALVLINSIGGSTWARHGSALRSMAERPLWDWGIHFPADLLPMRQARRVLPVIVAEVLPNLWRDPRAFWSAARLARRADLTSELDGLRRRRLPVVVLWVA